MNWKVEMVEKLRDYPAKIKALEQIPQRLKMLELSYTGIRAARSDGNPVPGGTNQREDMLLNNIVEREELKLNYTIVNRQVRLIEKGLEGLTDEQKLILDRFYINRASGYVDRLCDELHFEKPTLYRKKDQALRKMAMQMYGVIEL